ncbi:MAG: TonB-dependent receptor [Candidatus Brocadiaceae bacterium]|nr:TonB-dependent receptor [Candidatus Brocadiaceae bacterium]
MKTYYLISFLILFIMSGITSANSEQLPDIISLKPKTRIEEEIKWLQAEAVVFSASRHEQKVSEAAAAVYVVSNEDIRRSGATTIPDILRMVPGLQVSQINSNMWGITSRGFNRRFSDKLLVLMDGRSIYSSTFTGVLWEAKDTLLEDIERIEVIRGPGAALWGANAVNGIINIITKKAEDTQGALLTFGTGNIERSFGGVRYGGRLGNSLFYRGYAKYFDRDGYNVSSSSENANDSWDAIRGGFKINWEATENDSFTFQGDTYDGDAGNLENFVAPPPLTPISNTRNDRKFFGGNVLARFKHTFSDKSDCTLQLYFDRTVDRYDYIDVNSANRKTGAEINTYDLDFQHRFSLGNRNEITWGLSTRHIYDKIRNSANVSNTRKHRHAPLYSTFFQDEITLIEDNLKLILGTKFANNDYSGSEIMPNARLLWTPDKQNTVWASVSRAVKTPTRVQHDLNELYLSRLATAPLPTFLIAKGDKDTRPEDLVAYEIGYRFNPAEDASVDITAFYNNYKDLGTGELGILDLTNSPSYLFFPSVSDNRMTGDTYGVEVSVQWKALEWWQLHATYTYLDMQLHALGEDSVEPENQENQSPENQATFRSLMSLPKNLEFDTTVRYVDHIKQFNINSYAETDLRIGWKPKEGLDLSISGRNLLDNAHAEFEDSTFGAPSSDIERSVHLKVTWSF